MTTVELVPAYVWDCERCGRENFQRSVSVVLNPDDPDDADVIRQMHDIPDADPIPEGMSVRAMTTPDRVTCRHCEAEFKVACPNDDECPDDDGDY